MALSARMTASLEGVGIAIDALRANRVRAGLTILGIAVGVFVVVAMSAAIHGINASVAKEFESVGPTTFYVSRYPITFEACDDSDETCKWRNNPQLTLDETRLLNDLPGIHAAGAKVEWGAAVRYRGKNLNGASLWAYTANWPEIDGGDVFPGRSWTYAEGINADRVAIISEKMATELFGESDPMDKDILIRDVPFRVIGVFHYPASFLSGGDRARVVVPIQTAVRHLGVRSEWMNLAIKPRPEVARDVAIDEVTAALRARRGLRPAQENDFAIITQDQFFDLYNKIFGMFFLVMFVLSAVGLMVGGVGVVAIMMISVTERTREIGVRKALGATRGTILWQFLVEAVTLTGIGAAVGFVAGWLLSFGIRSWTPIPASIPGWAVLAAVGASIFTGVLFGIMPAARAARLDPVTALRYE